MSTFTIDAEITSRRTPGPPRIFTAVQTDLIQFVEVGCELLEDYRESRSATASPGFGEFSLEALTILVPSWADRITPATQFATSSVQAPEQFRVRLRQQNITRPWIALQGRVVKFVDLLPAVGILSLSR